MSYTPSSSLIVSPLLDTLTCDVRVCVLGSGSSGNCTYIESGNTRVFVDLGFGPRSLKRRLGEADLDAHPVDGLLLTHGHSDHARGVAHCAASEIPIFMNQGTRSELPELPERATWSLIRSGEPFQIGDLCIESFSVSHDAADPIGYRFRGKGITGALLTDLGVLDGSVATYLSDCDWLIVESNYDDELLKLGPYPWFLKLRLLGRKGHLSNQALAEFLEEWFDGNASHIFLAHLSRQNNHPELALRSAERALSRRSSAAGGNALPALHLTHHSRPSAVLEL